MYTYGFTYNLKIIQSSCPQSSLVIPTNTIECEAYGFGCRRIRKFRVSGSKAGTKENCQTLVLWKQEG
ncbi:hypothetical protein BYT27DRAFT_7195630 [Phlegmacium glaucopus]|nr:hypothetical protein BYT27DRAFT_7195630 [Phlegmacium glaucopus]